jgi:hypothetical protein
MDLRCPFGCRLHHRRQRGNARSRKHNQTHQGRANKKKLNIAARIQAGQAAASDTAPVDTATSNAVPRPLEQSSQLTADSPSADCADAAMVDAAPVVDTSPTLLDQLTLNRDGFVLDARTLVNSRILPYVRIAGTKGNDKAVEHAAFA